MNTSSQITFGVYPRSVALTALRSQRILRARDEHRVQMRIAAVATAPDQILARRSGRLGSKLVGRLRRRAEEQLLSDLERPPVRADDLLAVGTGDRELLRSLLDVDRPVGSDPRQ
jgi:hypothetical protein